MMTKNTSIIIMFSFIYFFSSCEKDYVETLPGTWDCNQKTEVSNGGAIVSEIKTTITFNEDFTGTFGPESSFGEFEWIAQDASNSVKLRFNEDDDEDITFYTERNKSDKQVWVGSPYGFTVTLTMSR